MGRTALGLIFPPAILRSAAVLGAAAAAAGKIGQLHHGRELRAELESAIHPGHSGILPLVSDPAAGELRHAFRMIVQTAVDDVVAKDVKAAAKDAGEAEQAGRRNCSR